MLLSFVVLVTPTIIYTAGVHTGSTREADGTQLGHSRDSGPGCNQDADRTKLGHCRDTTGTQPEAAGTQTGLKHDRRRSRRRRGRKRRRRRRRTQKFR